jgi:hypothetical protein
MSVQEPQLENDESRSFQSDEFTVIALGSLAGEVEQASLASFPEAAITGIPALTSSITLVLRSSDLGPPTLRFTTAGPEIIAASARTLSKAEIITLVDVVLLHEKIRIGIIVAAFATPERVPAMVPAT